MTKEDAAVVEWIENSFDNADEITDDVIDALKSIFFTRKSISRKEAAQMLFGFEISCNWGRGAFHGGRLASGTCQKGDDIRVEYCFDNVRKMYDLCEAILKVSTQ